MTTVILCDVRKSAFTLVFGCLHKKRTCSTIALCFLCSHGRTYLLSWMCTWFIQWRTPPGCMDVYILHSLSKVAARSSAGSYCRSWHEEIWTLITDPDMSTYEVACTHKNIRNTAKLSIVCSDSWHHRDYSFTHSQGHDGLWCVHARWMGTTLRHNLEPTYCSC